MRQEFYAGLCLRLGKDMRRVLPTTTDSNDNLMLDRLLRQLTYSSVTRLHILKSSCHESDLNRHPQEYVQRLCESSSAAKWRIRSFAPPLFECF